MKKEQFFYEIKSKSEKIKIILNEEQCEKFYNYMNELIQENKKINLTAITEPLDIILKHFIDSITINKYIPENLSVIDIGTGAGFPGIPEKIIRSDLEITLADSLNKRLIFLDKVIEENGLTNIKTLHGRAEDIGKNKNYREKYDIAVSRAVAQLSVLLEYMLPLVKVGGKCICMKGSNAEEEINSAKKALNELGGKIGRVEEFLLPDSDIKRTIIIIEKTKSTDNKYPRKAGTPSKNPII